MLRFVKVLLLFGKECYSAYGESDSWIQRVLKVSAWVLTVLGLTAQLLSPSWLGVSKLTIGFGIALLISLIGGIRLAARVVKRAEEDAAKDPTKTPEGRLFLRLKARSAEIGRIATPHNEDSFNAAVNLLEIQQELVAKSLHRDSDLWLHKPYGWPEDAPPLWLWSALVTVLTRRYPDELSTYERLFARHPIRDDGKYVGQPSDFASLVSYSQQCVALLVREIQDPDWPFEPEPAETFLTRLTELRSEDATEPPRPSTPST